MSCDRILWYRTRGQKLYLSANTHRRLRKNQALLKGKSSVSQSLSGLLLALQSYERRHPRTFLRPEGFRLCPDKSTQSSPCHPTSSCVGHTRSAPHSWRPICTGLQSMSRSCSVALRDILPSSHA